MATGVGMGFDLSGLDTKLKALDAQLDKLIKKQETFSKTTIDTFRQMVTNGVEPVIHGLAKQRAQLEALSKIKGGGAMSEIKKEAKSALKEIDKVINAIKRTSTYKEYSTGNDDATRYEIWLRRKHREEQEHKRIEEEKYKATISAIKKQNEAYKNAEKERAAISQINSKAKSNSAKAKSDYDSTVRMYRNMFDEIERRRQKNEERERKADERRYNNWLKNKHKEEVEHKRIEDKKYKDTLESIRRQESAYANYTQGSLAASKQMFSPQGDKSLKNMKTVLKQLETAQANVNRSTKKGQKEYKELEKQINKVKTELDKAKGSSKGLSSTMGKLGGVLATYLSVSAISNYLNKLVQVRGEFEMQHKSLQVLLQDADKANEIWDKTVALAVKSPFKVKQLVTYTKQLAAYRIESEKLYDTTKMLADVSAGVGVDMQRLILAYGQVKAANFLRGTELRQFSEAGVNLLDELAERFTDIEGRAVSVADVFERVSKRQVSFSDVEAVFQKITGEGGVFYQMQEQRADTLQGQIANLNDAIDLMYNEIGKKHDKTMKNVVALARELVNNWRALYPYIKTAGTALLFYFGTGGLKGILKYSKMIVSTWKAHPWIMIASAVVTVISLVHDLVTQTNELDDALDEVNQHNMKGLEDSIELYSKLASQINDVTLSTKERTEAEKKLKNAFDEILPNEYLELSYIKDTANGYKDATDAMIAYYDAKALAQKKDKVEKIYGEDIDKETKELIDIYKKSGGLGSLMNADELRTVKANAGWIIRQVVEDVKNGKVEIENLGNEINKRLSEYTQIDISKFTKGRHQIWDKESQKLVYEEYNYDYINTLLKKGGDDGLINLLNERNREIQDLVGLPFRNITEQTTSKIKNAEKENIEKVEGYFSRLANLYEDFANNKLSQDDLEKDLGNVWKEINSDKSVEKYVSSLNAANEAMKAASQGGAFEFRKSLSEIQSTLLGDKGIASQLDSLANGQRTKTAQDTFVNLAESFREQAKDKLANPFQKAVIEAFETASKEGKISPDFLTQFIPDEKTTKSTVVTNIKGRLESITQIVKEYETSLATGADTESIISTTAEEVEEMKKQIPVLENILAMLGYSNEKKTGGAKKTIEDRIKVVDDMYKKFKELNQSLDFDDAANEAFNAYKDAFAEAYGRSDVKGMDATNFLSNILNFTDTSDIISWFDNTLIKMAKDGKDRLKVELAKGEYIGEGLKTAANNSKDVLQDTLDQLWGEYEMGIELDSEGIDRKKMKEIFGIESKTMEDLKQEMINLFGVGSIIDNQMSGKDILEAIRNAYSNEELKHLSQDKYDMLVSTAEKITEKEREEYEKRAKDYEKYLTNSLTKVEQIEREKQKKLKEIDSLKIDENVKAEMKKGVVEESDKEKRQALLDEFKHTNSYLMAVQDLEKMSKESIDNVIKRLESFGKELADLDPSELKEVYSLLEKLKGRSAELSLSFKGFWKNIKSVRLANDIRTEISKLEEQKMEAYSKLAFETDDEEIKKLKKEIEDTESKIKEKQQLLPPKEAAEEELESQLKNIEKIKEAWDDVYGNVAEVLVYYGEMTQEEADLISGMVDLSVAAVQTGISMATAGNTAALAWGWIALIIYAIEAAVKLLMFFNQKHDNRRQKQIEEEKEEVEALTRSYEELRASIEKTANLDYIQKGNKRSIQNIEAQIASYERMIELEESKKKSDENAIKEYQNSIYDLKQQMQELREEAFSDASGGILDSTRDAASSFVDAWYEAFKETGSGMDALSDKFKENLLEMVKNQAALLISGSYLDNWKKQLEGYINLDDMKLDAEEAKTWADSVMNDFPALNESLRTFFESFENAGVDLGGASELSGLQRGISGITEAQADILASYWNAVRFSMSNIEKMFDIPLSSLLPSDVSTENPMVNELRAISSYTRDIRDMVSSMMTKHPTEVGQGLKVIM